MLISFLFSCLNFQNNFLFFLFLFNFHSDFKIIVLISAFIVLIPILISGLKFHSNKFDCLNYQIIIIFSR